MIVVAVVGALHGALRGHDRPRAERHQEGAGVLDGLAARLHVPGLRRRRLRGGHLPRHDARLLQGLPLPRLGLGDPRACRASRTSARWAGSRRRSRRRTGRSSSRRSRSRACRSSPASSRRTRSWRRSSRREFEGVPWLPRRSGRSALLTAGLTAFYMFRLVSLTFYGAFRGTPEQEHHIHESPRVDDGAARRPRRRSRSSAGYVGVPIVERGEPDRAVPDARSACRSPARRDGAAHHAPLSIELALMAASVAVAAVGIFLALVLVRARATAASRRAWPQRFPGVYRTVSNKYYVDEVYEAVFVRGLAMGGGRAALGGRRHGRGPDPQRRGRRRRGRSRGSPRLFDQYVVDGLVNGVANSLQAALPALPPGADRPRPELRARHGRGTLLRSWPVYLLVPMR